MYDASGNLSMPIGIGQKYSARRIASVKNPSVKYIFSEANNYLWLFFVNLSQVGWWHNNGSNFLCFDGHVIYKTAKSFNFSLASSWAEPAYTENKKLLRPDY